MWLAERPGSEQRTFGWARAEIMAAMLNGGALLFIAGLITWQAIERLGGDPDIAGAELLGFALVGLVANLLAAAALRGGQHTNLNVRGAYYHVLGDALGSVGALISGIVILASGWTTIDALASFVIAALIAVNAVRLLREATNVLLEAAPSGLAVEEVARELCEVPGVLGLHDLHLWTVSSGFPALACHVEIEDSTVAEAVLMRATERLQSRFGIQHVTLQPETSAIHAAMACCEFPDLAGLGAYSVGHREGMIGVDRHRLVADGGDKGGAVAEAHLIAVLDPIRRLGQRDRDEEVFVVLAVRLRGLHSDRARRADGQAAYGLVEPADHLP